MLIDFHATVVDHAIYPDNEGEPWLIIWAVPFEDEQNFHHPYLVEVHIQQPLAEQALRMIKGSKDTMHFLGIALMKPKFETDSDLPVAASILVVACSR